MHKHPLYKTWNAIRQRCNNSNVKAYPRYGGRGIRMCSRWQADFWSFVQDMKPRPSPQHSVERRDNDGDYDPDNCYWGTREEQANNKSTTCLLTVAGVTKSISRWSRQTGILAETIRYRMQHGWDSDRILETPVRNWGRMTEGERQRLRGQSPDIEVFLRLILAQIHDDCGAYTETHGYALSTRKAMSLLINQRYNIERNADTNCAV